VAILLALASPELAVKAITTVAGNVAVEHTTRNALSLLELAGRPEVPVYPGCPRPMLRQLQTAHHVHGEEGLEGARLPAPRLTAQRRHAVAYLIETLSVPGEPVTVVAIGPLTNLAMALVAAPGIASRLQEIVIMGGAFRTGGNTSRAAEFNMLVDPHAADVVFRAGVPIVMMPLDVTHQALTTPERLGRIRAIANPVARTVADILAARPGSDVARFGAPGWPLHDPTTIAYLVRPELFGGRDVHVAVETASELTLGQTLVDWWGKSGAKPNARFMHELDADGFFRLLTRRLGGD
jgi:purine nucleosidase